MEKVRCATKRERKERKESLTTSKIPGGHIELALVKVLLFRTINCS